MEQAAHTPDNSSPIWTPDSKRVQQSRMHMFLSRLESRANITLPGYQDLWGWSVENIPEFWSEIWDFCGIIGDKGDDILIDPSQMPGATFFPNGKLNYAENLLRRRDDGAAIIFRKETGENTTLTFEDLYNKVSLFQQALKQAGVQKGDRIAGYLPNMPEAIIAALAANSIGAIWSSASPDFGVKGVLDRFGQIEPKILIGVDGYFYNGKTIDCLGKIKEVQQDLPSLEKTIIIPFADTAPDLSTLDRKTILWTEFISPFSPGDISFAQLPFNHPLFIMFSSGTTGKPKSIVHGQGGTLIQHLKEHQLHCDIGRDDRIFYFTTTGWMMWNWLITALASEACVMLYDGSPFYPGPNVLWDFVDDHNCKLFGTGAKYIDALRNEEISPKDTHNLESLQILCSTGSPLVHESFDYIYDSIKPDLHVSSISGGTDIISCFVLGNPISPVYRGEIQGPGLGMAVDVLDDDGKSVPPEQGSGELVCTKPFPSMPVYFWNDPENTRFHKAYFKTYPDVWAHGDWIEKTRNGGFIIHGRSDATLNPGGVRIGTAEIYRQVEQIPAIRESIAVGQQWDGDERVILFVVMNDELRLTDDLKEKIKKHIRSGASPRHVPAKIMSVPDIPRTKSGKIVELAVRNILHDRPVKNIEALANPEALEHFKNLEELKE